MQTDTIAFLREVRLFADLPEDGLSAMAQRARWRQLEAGEVLLTEGDTDQDVAVVHSGRVEIIRTINDERTIIGTAGRGATIGELSLLTRAPRMATIRAVRATRVLVLGAADFEELLVDHPHACLALARTLAGRLVHGRPPAPLSTHPTTIALLPLAGALPIGQIAALLERELALAGSVTVLTRPVEHADKAGNSERAWLAHLDEAEQQHDMVLLVCADPVHEPHWSRFCTRSSDRVLLLSRGGSAPSWAVDDPGCRNRDLVFVTNDPSPQRLGPSLGQLHPRAHHLLPTGSSPDDAVRRMARRASGRATGVVFSGGGARGHAHVGAIQGLAEAGVTIDRVGGCSAGAIAAGLVAVGMDTATLTETVREEFADHNPFGDMTVPREALTKGKRVRAALERMFGSIAIESLPVSTFVVSADLNSGELVEHRTGSLADAITASLSIPGLAPPVRLDGRVLVDGGLLDNFPTDVMAAQAEGPVIGVDVMRSGSEAGEAQAGAAGLGIVATLTRSMMLGAAHRAARNRDLADLLVTPEVSDIGLLDFDRFDDAVAAGREATIAALADWRAQ